MYDVCVVGSLNMDLVLSVDKIPSIGETILANDLKKIPGGKGANQAVASARLGSKVVMVGCVGNDDNGNILIENLKKDEIEVNYIKTIDEIPTGIALITVDKKANNSITVVPGANMQISVEDICNLDKVIEDSKLVVAQFETPIETITKAFNIAKEKGKFTILNPAPAKEINQELISLSDVIVPNETETQVITGIDPKDDTSIKEAGQVLIEKGAKNVIITLGSRGAAVIDKDNFMIIDAYKVDAVDTTAAGDSFIGGVAYYLTKHGRYDYNFLCDAVKFANKVSSIAVTKEGAQSSLPYLKEVVERFGE